jgi:4-diphosphocytidyl-2C-methyl-D-erythritol kinase
VVTGRGERIAPIKGRGDYWVVVVVPPFQVSTREAYQWLDLEKGWTSEDQSRGMENLERLLHGPIDRWEFFNAFAPILEERYPVYREIKSIFR